MATPTQPIRGNVNLFVWNGSAWIPWNGSGAGASTPFGNPMPADGIAIGGEDDSGNFAPFLFDSSGNLKVTSTGGGGGGTSSTYGAAFPSAGTAAGFSDGTNMQPGRVDASGAQMAALADGKDATQGAKADAAASDSTSAWSVVALLKGLYALLNPFSTAGGGGYVRQDSTATIAKETGGNLAAVASVEGTTADAKVTGDNTGTDAAKLRGLNYLLALVTDTINGWLKVEIQNASITVTIANPSTGTTSRTAVNAGNVTVLASNASRKGAVLVNESDIIARVKFGTTATATDYSIILLPGGTIGRDLLQGYTGRIDAIWDSAGSGAMQVTELT